MVGAANLVDWSPVAGLLLLVAVLALLPLGWWLWRSQARTPAGRWQALALLTAFLTFDLVVFGAFTRLTDSGLGCPDWPGCYGSVTPVGAKQEIDAAESAMPHGPVTTHKAWIEMVHRKMAAAIGALTLVLFALSVYWRAQLPFSPLWPGITFIWVCVQGAFGALTVTWRLFPAIVSLHLLGGMVLLGLLVAQTCRLSVQMGRKMCLKVLAEHRLWMWLSLGFLMVQIMLGAWVSTNYAVLACTEFPMCQGQWWPEMNFRDGFEIWHELGKLRRGDNLDMSAITAIHITHRCFAFAFLAVSLTLLWRIRQLMPLRFWRNLLGLVLLTQCLTGLANVVLGWPLAAALMHTAGAALLLVGHLQLLSSTRSWP